jgi:hypothetical protein
MDDANNPAEPALAGTLQEMPTGGLRLLLSTHLAYMLSSTWHKSDDTRNELRRAVEVFNVLADRLAPD